MALSREDLRQLALAGARTRLEELDAERRGLMQEFPELRSGGRGRRAAASEPRAGGARTRRNLTAAQRRAISKRMKALWAERRKAKKAA